MTYDPAWDMPRVNWQQQGSFEIPEIPPAYEPDAEPLVCLPPINQYWLPYIMGALDQLRNPSSWLVADDDAMSTTLYRVSKLREMIGGRAECMSFMIRFDGASCQLQQSIDQGITWEEVTGWGDFVACLPPQTRIELTDTCTLAESFDGGSIYTPVLGWEENFPGCVQDNVPIIGLPPNPGDQSPDQLACSIATYLAEQVILGAMDTAVTAIQDDLTLLTFGANVLTLIPEFVLVKLGYDAIATIYGAVQEGTLSDYEDALTDAALWQSVACAIYSAIKTTGYATPGNFAAILTAIGGIPYIHADVIAAIESYVSQLGATGLAQLSQISGLVTDADCSCGGEWCYRWDSDGTTGDMNEWLTGSHFGTLTPGIGIVSENDGSGDAAIVISLAFTSSLITSIGLDYSCGAPANTGTRAIFSSSVDLGDLQFGTGPFSTTITPMEDLDNLTIALNSSGSLSPNIITSIQIHGTGTCPFTGGPNCTV